MREVGYVTHVVVKQSGDELAQDVLATATEIVVKDAADFMSPEVGTTLTIGDETIVYTAVDDDTGTITLATPLVNGYGIDQEVYLDGHEVKAQVRIGDDDEPYTALVPTQLIDRLGDNIYDALTRKVVHVGAEEDDPEQPIILQVVGELPELDGAYIDPVTLPTPPLTDGDPPASSPAVTLYVGVLSLVAQWDAVTNADAVLYDIHIDGTAVTGSTLLEENYAGTLKVITAHPDGTLLDPDSGYDVWVVAKDADGSAVAGAPGSGQPMRIIGSTHITDESIETPQLAANSVTADKALVNEIVAGGLSAEQVIAGALWTALSGRRTGMTAGDGFLSVDQNNEPLVSLPNDGSAAIINTDIIALSLLAQSGAILRGTSRITKGGALELESATETPMVSPIVSTTWPSVPLGNTDFPSAKRGLYWQSSDTSWFFCHALDVSSVVQVDADGSAINATPLVTNFAAFSAQGGITKIGSTWYVLGVNTDTGNWYVSRHDASFNVLGSWQYTDESAGFRPAIGTDGTHVLIARVAPNDGDKIKIRAYNPTTGALVSTVTSSSIEGTVDVTSVGVGLFDFDVSRYVVGVGPMGAGAVGAVKVYNSSGVRQADEEWWGAEMSRFAGLAWNGTQWWSLSQLNSKLSRYTANVWTSESAKWWVGYSLRDGDAVGGTHETPLSPTQTFTMKKRAAVQWTTPEIPDSGGTDDPDRVRVWVGRGASAPAESAMWLNASPLEGVVSDSIEAAVFSGTHFTGGKGADFTESTPAEIRTVDGHPLIRANGLPRVRVLNQIAVATNPSTDAAVGWEAAEIDTDNFWDISNQNNIIIPWTGTYDVEFWLKWANDATPAGSCRAWLEGSTNGGSSFSIKNRTLDTAAVAPATDGATTTNNWAGKLQLQAGEWVRLRRRQNSGAALDLLNGTLSLEFHGPV